MLYHVIELTFSEASAIYKASVLSKFKFKPATLLNSFNSLVTSKTSSVLRRNKIVSSAYCASLFCFILPFIDIDKPRSSCFICSARTSVAIINNKADIGQPCRIPLDSEIFSDNQ